MTTDPINFISCDLCSAVSIQLGKRSSEYFDNCILMAPDDARARLLCQVTDCDVNDTWAKKMLTPTYVSGMINIYGASKMSEVGSTCFYCGETP